ncbi:PAS domain S-box protein [Falsiroseomonas selenitidurans]|uniref:histidine kinase n=1 Tax=Falsiroseomonas selenitidurans TaxID=2716335 RepID=A0ABX1E8D1_9PROT|nr:PAS domain S-box protein [Falsiroseomonas selenitidurans]NKC33156.1 PAS domain S-box protein [Falsiroseomonas selenitidurans]
MIDRHSLSERDAKQQLVRAQQVGKLGSWEVDLVQNLLTWSEMVFSIFEIGREDFQGTEEAFFNLIHPDDRRDFLKAREDWLARGGPFLFEHRIVTPAGKVKWVVERAEILTNEGGEPLFTTGTVQDITDLRQAELARNEAEQELLRQARLVKLVGKIGKIGGWRYDIATSRLEWSGETARIHDEPEGTQPTLDQAITYFIPEHREGLRAQFRACATEGCPFDETLQIETAKGRLLWVHVLGEPMRNEAGEIVAAEGAFQDVTDLMAVRDEAAALSVRLHRTLEGMTDAFYLLDDKWRFTFVNSKAELLLQKGRGDLLGRVAWEAFPDAAKNMKRQFELALCENRLVRFEEYNPRLEAWFEISVDPTPAGLAVYFHDVTKQRARDSQLRLLEAAVARLNDILLITEAEPIDAPDSPKIVYVNDAFERRTGFSREEVIGQTPRILQGPKTERSELDRIRKALEEWQPVRAELINYTRSGEEFWLELDIVPLADDSGWFTHWIAVERDITARKQTERLLRANEERFRLVTKAAGSAIWDLDVASGRLWWSEGLSEIFGHATDPSGSVPTVWRKHIHPGDAARVDAALERLMAGRDKVLREQYRFRRADGSWATVSDHAFALHDNQGKVRRVLGAMTDITEQKLLEDRFRQSQKMETVGQLTGGVAHDFNNLLTIILGNMEALEEDLGGLPHLQKLARMSLDAAERAAELTNRLLAFSRRQTLEPRVLDVAMLIQGMADMLRRTLPESIDIKIAGSGGLWNIEADAVQLESAILNLAVNARDAMPEGGNLTIEMANALLDEDYVSLEPDVKPGQYVVIVVTDTGHGIPPEIVGRVFEPFFTTKEAGKGSGLGLSMVFGFVKQSGGHIRIYSELGEGTAIKIYFPRSLAQQERIVTRRAGPRVTGGTETILVVEDDAAVRAHVIAQLQLLGYRVMQASTGAAALEILRQTHEIDLLFTDVVMPGGMGGRDLAEAARRGRPNLKVLFTSGYTENSIVHNGRLDKGVKLLSKPYRREQLAAKIREALAVKDEGNEP